MDNKHVAARAVSAASPNNREWNDYYHQALTDCGKAFPGSNGGPTPRDMASELLKGKADMHERGELHAWQLEAFTSALENIFGARYGDVLSYPRARSEGDEIVRATLESMRDQNARVVPLSRYALSDNERAARDASSPPARGGRIAASAGGRTPAEAHVAAGRLHSVRQAEADTPTPTLTSRTPRAPRGFPDASSSFSSSRSSTSSSSSSSPGASSASGIAGSSIALHSQTQPGVSGQSEQDAKYAMPESEYASARAAVASCADQARGNEIDSSDGEAAASGHGFDADRTVKDPEPPIGGVGLASRLSSSAGPSPAEPFRLRPANLGPFDAALDEQRQASAGRPQRPPTEPDGETTRASRSNANRPGSLHTSGPVDSDTGARTPDVTFALQRGLDQQPDPDPAAAFTASDQVSTGDKPPAAQEPAKRGDHARPDGSSLEVPPPGPAETPPPPPPAQPPASDQA